MSTTIDQRVVSLKFDNAQFEQNVQVSLTTLDKLRESLKFGDETKQTFDAIENNSKNVKMSGLASAIDNIKLKFSALDVVGTTVLANLTTLATNKVLGVMHTAFDSIIGGGLRRAQNLEQAYFKMGNLFTDMGQTVWDTGKKTKEVMEMVGNAVDGTAFSMDEAAVVASQLSATFGDETFKNNGSKMNKSLNAIANLASLTGSSFADMGNIFATVAGNGRLMGDQLLQFSSRGLNIAADLARAWGVTEEEVRDMVSRGEVSYDNFLNAISKIPKYMDAASKANKTFSGALANTKSALSRIGADVFAGTQNQQGALESVRKVLLACKVAIDTTHKAIAPLLEGIAALIEFLSNKAIKVLDKFSSAFADITNNYKEGEVGVNDLTKKGNKLKHVFEGLVAAVQSFALLIGIAFKIITIPLRPFVKSLGLMGDGFLTVGSKAADMAIALQKVLSSFNNALDKKLKTFDEAIKRIRKNIVLLVQGFIAWIKNFTKLGDRFNWFASTIKSGFNKFAEFFGLIEKQEKVGHGVSRAYEGFSGVLKKVKSAIENLIKPLKNYFKEIQNGVDKGTAFNNMINGFKESLTITNFIDAARKALEALGEVLMPILDKVADKFGANFNVSSEFESFKSTTSDICSNLTGSVSALDSFKKTVEAVGKAIKDAVNGNLGIGEVLAVLLGVGLIYGLRKLSKAFGSLAPVHDILSKISGGIGELSKTVKDFRFTMIAKQITAFALALSILVLAITQMAKLPANQVWAATLGITAIIAAIGGLALLLMSLEAKGIIGKGGKGKLKGLLGAGGTLLSLAKVLGAIALAISAMAATVFILGRMDPASFEQGMGALTVMLFALVGMVAAMMFLCRKFKGVYIAEKFMRGLGEAAIALAVSLKIISTIETEGLQSKILALVEICGLLVAFVTVMGLLTKHNILAEAKSMTGLISAALSLAIIVITVKMIEHLNPEKLQGNLIVVAAMMVALMNIMIIVGRAGEHAARGGRALLATSIAIGLMIVVVKMASMLSIGEVAKGIVICGLISTLFAGIILATKFAGEHAAKAGVTLLAMAGAMVVMTACIAVLAHIKLSGILKGLIAVTGLGAIMVALVLATKVANINEHTKSVLLMFAICLGVMTASLGVLSMIKPARLYSAVGALISVMGSFVTVFAITARLKLKKSKLKEFGILAGVMGAITICLAILAQMPSKNLAAAATALVGTLGAFSGALYILNSIGGLAQRSLTSIGILVILMGICGAFIFAISKMGLKPEHAMTIAALAAILVPLSITVGILSVIGPIAEAALAGAAALALVMVGMTALVAAIGAVAEHYPEMEEFVNKGADLLAAVGKAIGRFVGGIIEGAIDEVMEVLPNIGTKLSEFAENSKTFFDTIKGIDPNVAEGAKSAAEAILILCGTALLNKLAQSPLIGGADLYDKLSLNAPILGNAIYNFAQSVQRLSEEDIAQIKLASEGGKALAEFITAIPKSGGAISWFAGDRDFDSFSDGLNSFAEAFISANEQLSGAEINVKAFKNAAEGAGYISDVQAGLTRTGKSVISFFAGEKDLGKFAENLTTLGSGLKNFSLEVNQISNFEKFTDAAWAVGKLAEAQKVAIDKLFSSTSINAMATNFGTLGRGLKSFSSETSAIDYEKVTKAASAATKLASAIKNAVGASGSKIDSFKSSAEAVGNTIKSFTENAGGKGSQIVQKVKVKLTSSVDSLSFSTSILSAIKKVQATSETASSKMGEAVGNKAVNAFKNVKGADKAGVNLSLGFRKGITENNMAAYRAGYEQGAAALRGVKAGAYIHSPSTKAREYGGYIGEGLRRGLISYFTKVYKTGKNMGKNALDGIDSEVRMMSMDYDPVIKPVLDLSNIEQGAGAINGLLDTGTVTVGARNAFLASASLNNRSTASLLDDMKNAFVSSIKEMSGTNQNGNTYNINGITYDDGSNVVGAVETLVRAAKIERRI